MMSFNISPLYIVLLGQVAQEGNGQYM